MSNREKKIKDGLNKELYQKLDSLDELNDDTVSSNQKLSNILDGYVTRMDSVGVDDPDLTLEILNEEEVEIEVDLEGLEEEYNENLLRDETNILLPKDQISNFDEEIDFDTTSGLDKKLSEVDEEVISVTDEKESVQQKKRFQTLDIILIVTVIICIVLLVVVLG